MIAMLVAPLLLMIWLSLTCQSCFASEMDATQMDHSQMGHSKKDCCSSMMDESLDMADCDAEKLPQQTLSSDIVNFQVEDGQVIGLALPESDYPLSPSSGFQPLAVLSEHAPFSHRLFASYRVLHI